MRLTLAFLVCLSSTIASAESLVPYATGWRPNPTFQPIRLRASSPRGSVQQLGEVVVLEGDDDVVAMSMSGGFAIDVQEGTPVNITERFYTRYPDLFDEIVVFTTFTDEGASGAAAYEVSAQNNAAGIGRAKFDQSIGWGSKDRKLFAFVNMMKWDQFGGAAQLANPNSYLYPVLAQEFAHRWLSFLRYVDSNGVVSQAMLGRDKSHWASTLQAYGSVMDGNLLSDDGDGWYSLMGNSFTYSPLDLYGMGLVGKDEVPPFFLVHDAVTDKGRKVNPEQALYGTKKIQGTREDITIDQVIAAEGQRLPVVGQSQSSFRVAFVLLTRPGELADSESVREAAAAIEQARKVWEYKFSQYTKGRGTMCTQVSAPCGSATARIAGGEVTEAGGNHNKVVDPGEPVFVHFKLWNDSPSEAKAITVRALGPVVDGKSEATLSSLAPAATTTMPFYGTIPEDAQCGVPLTIEAEAVVDGNTFRGFTRVTPGLTGLFKDDFEASRGPFTVNRDGTDTATTNGWEYGTPTAYTSRGGWAFQPTGGHSGDKAWFTGLVLGHRGETDSSLSPGTSTLTMQPFDLSQAYQPELRYFAWFQAIDFVNPQAGGEAVTNVSMFLEGSSDGGKSWVVLDEINIADSRWMERKVPLDGKLSLARPVTFRFRVYNPSQAGVDDRKLAIEAGVDDFEITTLTAACNPDAILPGGGMLPPTGGCACDVGGPARLPGALVLLLVPILMLLRRRSRAH